MFCRDVWPLFRDLTGPDLRRKTKRNVTWKKKEERKLIIIIIKKIKKRRSKSTYDKLWCTIYVIREILSCYWKLQLRVTLPVNQISRATRIGGWFYAGERSVNGIHLMEKKKKYLEEIFSFLYKCALDTTRKE